MPQLGCIGLSWPLAKPAHLGVAPSIFTTVQITVLEMSMRQIAAVAAKSKKFKDPVLFRIALKSIPFN